MVGGPGLPRQITGGKSVELIINDHATNDLFPAFPALQ